MEREIWKAYLKAWNECKNPELDGKNPHFGNRYATLASTLKEVREVCKKYDLIYMQTLKTKEDGYVLESYLCDGKESVSLSTFPVIVINDPQKFGSEMTYRKRQQAQADWGIVGEEDDDANAAEEAKPEPRKTVRKASAKQIQVISQAYADEMAMAQLLEFYKIQKVEDLTIKQASEIISQLRG